jgi:hypothetical protein
MNIAFITIYIYVISLPSLLLTLVGTSGKQQASEATSRALLGNDFPPSPTYQPTWEMYLCGIGDIVWD